MNDNQEVFALLMAKGGLTQGEAYLQAVNPELAPNVARVSGCKLASKPHIADRIQKLRRWIAANPELAPSMLLKAKNHCNALIEKAHQSGLQIEAQAVDRVWIVERYKELILRTIPPSAEMISRAEFVHAHHNWANAKVCLEALKALSNHFADALRDGDRKRREATAPKPGDGPIPIDESTDHVLERLERQVNETLREYADAAKEAGVDPAAAGASSLPGKEA